MKEMEVNYIMKTQGGRMNCGKMQRVVEAM